MISKRDLLRFGVAGAVAAIAGCDTDSRPAPEAITANPEPLARLRAAAALPVIRQDLIGAPVMLKSLDLLSRDGAFMVRAEDNDGAVGWALTNESQFSAAWPVFLKRVAPQFIGRDMRDFERHQEEAFIAGSNYKWQGLALWICFARAELAILDLIRPENGRARPCADRRGRARQRRGLLCQWQSHE